MLHTKNLSNGIRITYRTEKARGRVLMLVLLSHSLIPCGKQDQDERHAAAAGSVFCLMGSTNVFLFCVPFFDDAQIIVRNFVLCPLFPRDRASLRNGLSCHDYNRTKG